MLLNSIPWVRHIPLFGHFGQDTMIKCELAVRENSSENRFLRNKSASLQFREHIYPQIDKYREVVKDNPEHEADNFAWAYMAELERRRRTGEDMSYFR